MKPTGNSTIQIGSRTLGPGHKPYLIAEMSGNHNQSLDRALMIVEAAAKSGAHAVKLQTYRADTMTLNSDSKDFVIQDEGNLWKGKNLYKLYEEAATPYEWHAPIMKRCQELGMECFSSPFDAEAVDFLMDLEVPCFKIASFEATYFPLLKKVAKTGKPVIMSTGMASEEEIRDSVKYLKDNGCKDLILLKCTSTYPASPESTNILTIPDMRERFQTMVGLSDHTMGCGVAVASVALGAVAIEKHFTLRRADGGVDSAFSMEPEEFKLLATESERAFLALGQVTYGTQNANEEYSRKYRRSIYVSRDLKKGEVFSEDNLKCVRPAFGLSTKHFDSILGKKSKHDLKMGTPLKLEDVE
jgi:pseudaminic acid synthase